MDVVDQQRPVHVVTGASSGIGRAVAGALAARGERVIAAARSSDALDALRDECGPGLEPVTADVTTDAGRRSIAAAIGGGCPVASLVHGAGSIVDPEPFATIDAEALTEHFRVHVAAPIALCNLLAATHQVERVVHFDSYSASTPRHGWAAYSIVKSAAQMTARCAAEEANPSTVVLRVFTGAVRTPLVEAILASDSPAGDTFRGLRDGGQLAEPGTIGARIAALLLDASADELRREPTHHLDQAF